MPISSEGSSRVVSDEAETRPRRRSYSDGPSSMRSAVGGEEPGRPNALIDIEADVARTSPEPTPEPEPAPAPEPEPEPVAIVLTPPDPDRPKRGGWWSKAKSAVTGG